MVKKFTHQGYEMRENRKSDHVRKVAAKANAVMGRIWSIGERTFKNWKL